jgi:TonB family protein
MMKNKILPLITFALLTISAVGQTSATAPVAPEQKDTTVRGFNIIQSMPEFTGQGGFHHYLASTISYPSVEKANGVEGTVYVTFIVERDGSISNVRVKNREQNSPALEAEALRVIEMMPAWKAGTLNGKPVAIEMTQPVNFVLKGKKKRG